MTDYEAFSTLYKDLGLDMPPPTRERWATEIVRSTLVAANGERVDGYVHVHALGSVGYVRQLVVREQVRGQGAGAQLMLHAAAALKVVGIREWHLNVKEDNAPAIRLYEKLGLRVEHRSTALRFPWARLAELPREDAMALPVAAEEDDVLERGLGMLSGQIAMARRRPGTVLRQLRAADYAPVGFAAFDPAFPGARTFRVARPALAGTLLATLRHHTRTGDLALVIDDHPALVDLLVTQGAIVKLQLVHYAGQLPELSAL